MRQLDIIIGLQSSRVEANGFYQDEQQDFLDKSMTKTRTPPGCQRPPLLLSWKLRCDVIIFSLMSRWSYSENTTGISIRA